MPAEYATTRPTNTHSNRQPHSSCPYRAFTLIELVIVIVIIAIAATIAVPRFTEAASRHRLNAAARRIMADIDLAKQLARTTSCQHRVRFVRLTDKYVIEKKVGTNTWSAIPDLNHPGSGYQVNLDQSPYEIDVASTNKAAVVTDLSIVFDGYGTSTDDAWVTIKSGKSLKKVSFVASTGTVNAEDIAQTLPTVVPAATAAPAQTLPSQAAQAAQGQLGNN